MRTPHPRDSIGLSNLRNWLVQRIGGLPRRGEPQVETLDVWSRDDHEIHYLRYRRGEELIPAYLLVPRGLRGPRPAVLALHQHNGQYQWGKSEPVGIAGDVSQAVAERLAQAGFVVLAPDSVAFEERQGALLRGPDYERFLALCEILQGRTLASLMISDAMAGVDVLRSRSEVDAQRLGVIGHSMGGTLALWVAALDVRLKVAVVNCGMASYRAVLRDQVNHCFLWYVPGLLPTCDHAQLAALVAPRALLISAGRRDGGFPVDGVLEAYHYARQTYRGLRVPQKIDLHLDDCGHGFSEERHTKALWWLKRWLGPV